MEVEYYSHVMHIVSNVTGTLAPDKDAFDALQRIVDRIDPGYRA
jgi:anthranilate synthase component 1